MRPFPLMRVLLVVLLLGLASQTAFAQTDPNLEQGIKPYASLDGGDIDAVNMTNGHLTFRAPLYSLPQRGGKLKLSFSILYDNNGFLFLSTCQPPPAHSCTFNVRWRGTGAQIVNDQTFLVQSTPVNSGQKISNGDAVDIPVLSVLEPDGYSAQLLLTTLGNYESIDGTGFRFDSDDPDGASASGTLTDAMGIHYGPRAGVLAEDPNGNYISYSATSGYTDTLGRIIPPFPISSGSPSSCPALNFPYQAATSASTWTLLAPSGATMPVIICSASVYMRTSLCGTVTPCFEFSSSETLIQSIVLPNGTFWAFQYDAANPNVSTSIGYGNLLSVTLPTGGSISYSYAVQNNACTSALSSSSPYRPPVSTRSVNANDGTGAHAWTYSWGAQASGVATNSVTDPLGQKSVRTITAPGPTNCSLMETQRQDYDSKGNLLRTVNTVYSNTSDPVGNYTGTPLSGSVVPTSITTTWPNGQVSQIKKTYDTGFTALDPAANITVFCPTCINDITTYPEIYGQPLTTSEYDYGSGKPGALLRTTTTQYEAFISSPYLTNNLLGLPSSVQITDGGGTQRALTTYGYDAGTPASSGISTQHDSNPSDGANRGNQTSAAKWLNTTGGNIISSATYFDSGEMQTATDPNGNKTTYAYSSTDAGAYPTTITNALTQSTTNAYDFNTGLLTSTTDPNSRTTSFTYDDMFRLASVTYPDGGSGKITHQETTFPFTATLTKEITSSLNYVTTNTFDGLGRVSQSQLTSDPDGTTYNVTVYDALGRKGTVYNPTRCNPPTTNCGEPTWGFSTYAYDALNRTTQVTQPDGSGSLVQTSYTGNTTTVTDEAGKKRESVADGLGRLTEVFEDPSNLNYETVYTYDALNNLTSVVQNGSRNRTFVYDSLSRLTSSINPESNTSPSTGGTVATTYTYDADGNLTNKTMPAQNQTGTATVTLTYCYDALNRMTAKAYTSQTCSNGTVPSPVATYSYDQTTSNGLTITNGIGRRTGMTDAAGNEAWSYDVMGRVLTDQRTTNAITKDTTYLYLPYLDGSLYKLTYPSGFVITQQTGGAERLLSAVYSTTPVNFATNAHYAPQGALSSLQNGASMVSTLFYNDRLQPCRISAKSSGTAPSSCTDTTDIGNLLDYTYNFSVGAGDNGNVTGITNKGFPNRSQGFTYDTLNRITSAATTATHATDPTDCWGEAYLYDNLTTVGGAWGNLTSIGVASSAYTGCTQESLSQSASAANQLSGLTYDTAGNVLSDGTHTYTYNAENQLTSAAGVNYTYDGDGKRVEKSSGKIYWYGMQSDALMETNLSGNLTDQYVFFGGRRIARSDASANVVYYLADHLGTSRIVTNATGGILDQSDFYPFGGERVLTSSSGNTYKFTAKERDSESNLDNFGARFDSSSIGRFMSPDDPFMDQHTGDPQSWNLYSYVRNNPLNSTDPDGHECTKDSTGNFHGDCSSPGDEKVTQGDKPQVIQVKAKAPPAIVVFAVNLFNAFDNVANDYFSFFLGGYRPSYMQNTQIGNGFAAQAGAIVGVVGTALIGPAGEAEDGIRITEAALEHVLETHAPGGANTLGKSMFSAGEDIKGLIQGAGSAPAQTSGNVLIRTVDAGRAIGIDRTTGQATSVYTVVTKSSGELITAYPGRP